MASMCLYSQYWIIILQTFHREHQTRFIEEIDIFQLAYNISRLSENIQLYSVYGPQCMCMLKHFIEIEFQCKMSEKEPTLSQQSFLPAAPTIKRKLNTHREYIQLKKTVFPHIEFVLNFKVALIDISCPLCCLHYYLFACSWQRHRAQFIKVQKESILHM